MGYIAPEILRLQSPPTPAADVYAIGVLLWTLVTGKMPEDQPDASNVKETLGPISWVVQRCLANDPKERYTTAEEILDQLDDLRD